MNYSAHYDRLMDRARNRTLDGYRECHHVLPRCMGGSDDKQNLVGLTAEEHYVAHQLLVKMYPDVIHLATAAMWMAKRCTGNKAYGWLRRRNSVAASLFLLGKKVKPRSAEYRAKMSLAKRGNKNSLGCLRTEETRAKIALSKKGKKRDAFSLDWRAKMSSASLGKKKSAEHCANISAGRRAMFLSKQRVNLA